MSGVEFGKRGDASVQGEFNRTLAGFRLRGPVAEHHGDNENTDTKK